MNDLNLCQFIGRLGKDPESRYSAKGNQITNFSIAVGRQFKDSSGDKQEATEWVNFVAFGKQAEVISNYLKKGSRVHVSGEFRTEEYEKNGEKKYATKIYVTRLQMLDSKQDGGASNNASKPASQNKSNQSGWDDFSDDIPF